MDDLFILELHHLFIWKCFRFNNWIFKSSLDQNYQWINKNKISKKRKPMKFYFKNNILIFAFFFSIRLICGLRFDFLFVFFFSSFIYFGTFFFYFIFYSYLTLLNWNTLSDKKPWIKPIVKHCKNAFVYCYFIFYLL